MTNKKEMLKEVLRNIRPSKEELVGMNNGVKEFVNKINKKIKQSKINASLFVGGSFAKNTLIKKNEYDVDVFIRFDKKHKNEDISKLTEKLLGDEKNVSLIHGSRDYFSVKAKPNFVIEIIPVLNVKTPDEAENITDLSYSHVKYIKKNVKKDVLDEILLAKAFCHANKCYGAESYIKGFSGYSLELLIYYYKSFMNFVKAMTKSGGGKIIIDIEKDYKNKHQIMIDLNSSKIQSPIILIDPTQKQRNATAALSKETFEKFRGACKKFLKNPSSKAFEIEKIDLEKIEKDAKIQKYEFILLEATTNKQEGDIAGSKLLKFYKHFSDEMSKFFEIKKSGFEYNGKKSAKYFLVVKNKGEILASGPSTKDTKNVKAFKKKHKNTLIKKGRIYAREKIKFGVKEFVKKWVLKYREQMSEMSIEGLESL